MSIAYRDGSEYIKSYMYLENAEVVTESKLFNNMAAGNSSSANLPYLKVLIQPIEKFRYRYGSEKGSHGTLTGVKTDGKKKNFITVKLENYAGDRPIQLRASLYTDEDSPRPHVLELVGSNCEEGMCLAELSADNIAEFKKFSIRMFKKENVTENILKRKITIHEGKKRRKIVDQETLKRLEEEAQVEGADLYLKRNSSRLFFEAIDKELNQTICDGVFSDVIENHKTDSNLKIHRITPCSGKSTGGEDVILLCDKIKKDDTEVRFFEVDENGDTIWEENADFDSANVHHQVAIPFRTPKFRENIDAVVFIQLVTKETKESGNHVEFQFKVDELDVSRINKKRKMVRDDSDGQPVCKGRQIVNVSTATRNMNLSESSSSDYGSLGNDLSPVSKSDVDETDKFIESIIDNGQLPEVSSLLSYWNLDPGSSLYFDSDLPADLDQAQFFNQDQPQRFEDQPQCFEYQAQSMGTEPDVLTDAIAVNRSHTMQADANPIDPDPFLWSLPRSRLGGRPVRIEPDYIEYQSGHSNRRPVSYDAVRTSGEATIPVLLRLISVSLYAMEVVERFFINLYRRFYPKFYRFVYMMMYRFRRMRIALGGVWPRVSWYIHSFVQGMVGTFRSLKRNSVNDEDLSGRPCCTVCDDSEEPSGGRSFSRRKESRCLDYNTYNGRSRLRVGEISETRKTGLTQNQGELSIRGSPKQPVQPKNIFPVKKENQGLVSDDVEAKLCDYLNVDSRWKKLAVFVDMNENLISALAEFRNPTSTILTRFKKTYGENYKIALTNAFEKTEFNEAVQMLKAF